MPLPAPADREPIHTRQVTTEGFARADGLWDLEGRLTDTKSYAFANHDRGTIAAGDPIHAMALRLTVDDDLVVRAVAASIDHAPFALCPRITPAFDALVGVRIAPGWKRQVRALLGGTKGCTHLVELLDALATTAFQTIGPIKARRAPPDPGRRPALLDSCHAQARSSPVVARQWPDWHQARD